MLRKFIDSLIIVRYMSIVFILAFITLTFGLGYNFTKIQALYYLTIVAGIFEFLSIIMFSLERVKSARQLGPIQRKEEYNTGVIAGDCVFIDKRMLAYRRGKLVESDYSNIQSVELEGKNTLRIKIGENTFNAIVNSPEDAELLSGFLKAKNPNIKFNNVVPRGKGTFQVIRPLSQERPAA